MIGRPAACGLLLCLAGALAAGAAPASAEEVMVRIAFQERNQVQRLADLGLDIWEVDREGGLLLARIRPERLSELHALGFAAWVDWEATQRFPSGIRVPPGYPCYRTFDQGVTDLQAAAAAHPSLVTLLDIGDAWESSHGGPQRDLLVTRVTNSAVAGPKPVFFLVAEHHAREMATPELAHDFLDWLLSGYGVDPLATFLIDRREIYIMPWANPDGRIQNESTTSFWRKNTDDDDGCTSPPDQGTDLNRNYSYQWGLDSGSSGSPCATTYRGPSATSEPEVSALQSFIASIFPGAGGILISLHTYGNYVLYPWAYTSAAAPDEPLLDQVARKLAQFNGYLWGQPAELLFYTASGTTDDFSYGALGVPSFTFECGEAFYQDCADLPGILNENRPAFAYAGRIADAAYVRAAGPDAAGTSVSPAVVPAGAVVHLESTVSDALSGAQVVTTAQAYLDTPPEAGGIALPMLASDGAFDESEEQVYLDLDTSLIPPGRHLLLVRGLDSAGNPGPLDAALLSVGPANLTTGSGSSSPLSRVRLFVGP